MTTPYATPTDIQTRYDVRRLGELVRDDGTRATAGQLNTDTTLQAMLDDASSLINSALIRGGKYTVNDLIGLSVGNDGNVLIRITCDLAYGLLHRRRGYTADEIAKLAPGFQEALNLLQQLEEGSMIFNIDTNIEASKVQRTSLSTHLRLVSSADRLFGDRDVLNPWGTITP